MSGWRREGCRITASPDLNTLFPASANLFATMAKLVKNRHSTHNPISVQITSDGVPGDWLA